MLAYFGYLTSEQSIACIQGANFCETEQKLNYVCIMKLNTFPYQETAIKGDIVLANDSNFNYNAQLRLFMFSTCNYTVRLSGL
jgi:hypothetical protein